ncbi:leucine/isoleucine/valine transporter subunit; ATP-binding component of ABC superfamily [Frankia canadensis]|uniref:Leucine/isoleucine/valine transporter subunit ATP-binding component of ABC superfamily n=1 Tax=Frankia canadensis TaxID=1836972 RepID=A0A2I2KQF7_9ACTN|nr:ABC transporter ATP-binding protein [Frankia canadensis]SNQ47889.1 leucine/isoleucine/valine transporter subunit; ATP-binding component of ABC superfamily [Frankia canadensis]SOU55179.1 leucine/isoleucine/valine transporter subunit; ATP-binding component of ABC superfamily [Frankia canadensis]
MTAPATNPASDCAPPGDAPERAPLLDLRAVTAGYGDKVVVRDVDLAVGPGEVVALLGPNGAGKTTMLATISGLLPALGGSIAVLGNPVDCRRPWRAAARGVAHVPYDRAIFFNLTVGENLGLARRPGGADLDRVLRYFPELGRLLRTRAGLLSGGEQQMLALGRALASDPRLLMIDEMSLGLAPIVVQRLLPIVRAIADETGIGVLLVEQHVNKALAVADRAYILSRGRVMVSGSADELRQRRELIESSYLGAAAL